jgi:anti-anti-sigma factor
MGLETTASSDPQKSLSRIRLRGSLDSDTAAAMEKALEDAIAGSSELVVLDMATLDYISSAGLRVIFKAAKSLKGEGRRLAVAKRQPQIEKVFEILQALPDMAVFANDDELDSYLDAMQARARGN